MRKKIDYSGLIKHATLKLKEINKLAKKFSGYESTEGVQKEIGEVLKLSGASQCKGNDRGVYSRLMMAFSIIEESLGEIDILTSDTIKKLNKLPEDKRKAVYLRTGIDEINESDQGISEQKAEILGKMMELVEEIMDESIKYYDIDKEEYVEFEDEVRELWGGGD